LEVNILLGRGIEAAFNLLSKHNVHVLLLRLSMLLGDLSVHHARLILLLKEDQEAVGLLRLGVKAALSFHRVLKVLVTLSNWVHHVLGALRFLNQILQSPLVDFIPLLYRKVFANYLAC
jgi:hypothetical protein